MLVWFALLLIILGWVGTAIIAWLSIPRRGWTMYLALTCIFLGATGSVLVVLDASKSTERAINPIRNVLIDVKLITKLETPHGEVYRSRIEKAISNLAKQKDGLKEIGLVPTCNNT
jgi:hypothetical protein